tara:strand:+ start:910 stop:1209 length:300 start_codon:yes stop_codon:yes gene_type:complete
MIGYLVHYNCGGSKAIGVVTDMFRYEAPTRRRMIEKNTLMISVEWVKIDPNGKMPAPVYPHSSNVFGTQDESFWPLDWDKKRWYNAQWFKVISDVEKKY